MPSYVANADMIVSVYQSVGVTDHYGFDSKYVNEEHPATNSLVEGWKWDEAFWPAFVESELSLTIPPTFTGDYLGVPDQDWQSGIGSGDDLKLLDLSVLYKNDKIHRVPVVNHGKYYLYDDEYYLFGDGAAFERMGDTLDSGSFQYDTISYIPKVGIPIRVFNYVTDRSRGVHGIFREFEKKQSFTPVISSGSALSTGTGTNFTHDNINKTSPEFVVRFSDPDLPPSIYLNGDYTYTNELDVTMSGVSGVFEIMGISTGAENQIFRTTYSPLIPSGDISVYSYSNTASPTQWTALAGITPSFTGQAVYECIVDEDVGTITFGDYNPLTLTGSGYRPAPGDNIVIQYSGCHWIAYEPEDTPDFYTGVDADTTVIYGESSNGFVHTTNEILEPVSLELSVDLDTVNDALYGPLDIGKNFAKVIATVFGAGGAVLAGENVVFEIDEPSFGGFNGENTATIASDIYGRAIVYYTPPNTIGDFGYATDNYSVAAGVTTINVLDGSSPYVGDYIYLYTVALSDVIGGMPSANVSSYYEDYFIEELIKSNGVTFGGALGDEIGVEEIYRNFWGLPVPTEYQPGDLSTGSKKIVMTYDSDAVDPQTGARGTYTALQPTEWEVTSSGVSFTYSGNLTLDSTDRSFYVVYPSNVTMRARVYNNYYRRWVYSNSITVNLNIPDSMSGLYFASDLANLPSGVLKRQLDYSEFIVQRDALIDYIGGDETDDEFLSSSVQELYEQSRIGEETVRQWFTRRYYADSEYFGLSDITPTATGSGVIPLGFRVTGASQTMASAVDTATFYNISDNVHSPYFTLIDDFREAPTATGDRYADYAVHYSRMVYQNYTSYTKFWTLENDAGGGYAQVYDSIGSSWDTYTPAAFLSAGATVYAECLYPQLKFRAFTSSSVASVKYAGFRVDMPDHENLSNITHMVFRAKGSGTVSIGFEAQNLIDTHGYGWYGTDIALQSTYQTYKIALSSLTPTSGATDWDDGKDVVNAMVFFATDGNDIEAYVDDIVLEGQSVFDFVENK